MYEAFVCRSQVTEFCSQAVVYSVSILISSKSLFSEIPFSYKCRLELFLCLRLNMFEFSKLYLNCLHLQCCLLLPPGQPPKKRMEVQLLTHLSDDEEAA